MKLNLSVDLAIVISIVTVFLFANGQAYLGGYLSAFRIDPIVLNFSIQDKIYIGYLRGFNYLLYSGYILFAYIVLKHIFISLDLPIKFSKYLSKKINKSNAKSNNLSIHNSTFYEELDSDYARNSFLALTVLILLISTIFLLAHTETKAKSIAEKELNNFQFKKVKFKNTKSNKEVFLVKCGANLCALIDKDKQVSLEDPKNIIFPLRDIKKAP